MSESIVNIGLVLTYIMLGIGVLAAVVFPILHMAQNPKSAKGALIGVGFLAVVFGLSYAIGGSEVTPAMEAMQATASTSKIVSAGLIGFYILFFVSIIAAIYSEVSRFFK
jgi:hypothetical protein